MATCPDCGIDPDAISVPDAAAAIRTFPRRYREALAGVSDEELRARPEPDTWSMLEYATHVREVLELYDLALPIVLEQSRPVFPPVDVDEAAANRPEWTLDVGFTLDSITRACTSLVARAEATPWAAWERPFSIGEVEYEARLFVQKAAHEGAHHLRDLARVRASVAPQAEDDE